MSDDSALDPREAETDDSGTITFSEVAAAAVTALEAIVAMLPDDVGQEVIDVFEHRCEAFKAGGL